MVKAGYQEKEDRGLEGFYGIGGSYPKKLCRGKASKQRLLPIVLSSIRVLRHRHPAHTDMPLEEIRKPFVLLRIPLIQRREKCPSHEEKAPSRSGFPLSMNVVLKTRHANPNIHVRRYQSYVRSPNLSATPHNFYPYAEQQPNRGHFTELYSFAPKAIQESAQSYIAFFAIPYSSIYVPIHLLWDHSTSPPLHYSYLLPSKIGVFRLRSSKGKYVKKQHSHRHRFDFLT